MSIADPKSVRCLLVSRHIGVVDCYHALFKKWGWQVDLLCRAPLRQVDGWYKNLPMFVKSALDENCGAGRRRWLLFKWIWFHRLVIRSRPRLGESVYVAALGALNRLGLIDDRWYLHALLPDWRQRAMGLSPPVARALRSHPAVARIAEAADVIVTAYCLGCFIELAQLMNERYGLRAIAISCHRFNQFKNTRAANEQLKADARRFAEREGCVKAVADDYDWHYEKHYLGIDAHRLRARPFHIRRDRLKPPGADSVLMTVVRNDPFRPDAYRVDEEFRRCYRRRRERGRPPRYRFEYLGEPRFGELEDLAAHAAIVVAPYSAYAFMNFEIYALNRPIFIPSVEFVVKHELIWDRALPTCWVPEYRQTADDADDADSPNSMLPEAQRLWVGRGFLHSREHCRVFEDWDDLLDQLDNLEEADCRDIAAAMREENERLDAETLAAWDKALARLDLPGAGE